MRPETTSTSISTSRERLITRPFAIVTLTALVFFVYIGMLVPIVPLFIEDELGAGEFAIGVTIAVFALTAIVCRPFIGRMADLYGRRALIVVGALGAAVAGGSTGFVTEFWQLLVLRGITGVGEAAMFVGAATLIADLSPPDRRAEGASYFSVAVFGGIGIGPLISEMFLDGDRYARAFVIAGGFALLSAVIALFAPDRIDPHGEPEELPAGAAPARRGFMHPVAVMPGLVLASGVAAFSTFGAFIPDYSRQLGLATSGGLFATYSLVSLVLRLFGATLPERLGPRRSSTISLTVVGIGLALLATVPTVPVLWISAVLMGVGMALNYPALFALTVNKVPDRERAFAISSFTMFFEVGSAVGGLAIGAFAQIVGKQIGFLGGVACCALGLWILWAKLLPHRDPIAVAAHDPATFCHVAGD